MRILHLGKYFPPDRGGVEQVTYELAKAAVKKKHDVTVFVFNTSSELKFEIIEGVKVFRFPRIKTIFRTPFTYPIFLILDKFKPDIIHLHIPNPWYEVNLFLYMLFNRKVKLVVTYHSDVINYTIFHVIGNLIRYLYLFPLLKIFPAKIFATSPNYVEGSFVLSKMKEKILVVPLGINIKKFKIKKKKSKKNTLLFVGRLFPYKGLEYLLHAIKVISDKRKDFELIIVGDGIKRKELEGLVESLKISSFVKFAGNVSDKDLDEYYNICDIFILPSIYKSEAFGIAQLEAMIHEKPVISTNLSGSGVPFVNKDKETGLVVETKNPKALADAIIYLLENEKLRKTFGKNGKKRVIKYFNLNKMTTKILDIYNQIIRG